MRRPPVPTDYRQMVPSLMHACRTMVTALFFSLGLAAVASSQDGPQAREGTSRPVAGDDTAIVHRELRKSIEKFQDSWRGAWKKVEAKRHPYINLNRIRGWNVRTTGIIEDPTWEGDRAAMNMTTELRRYLAILCNIDSPSDEQIEYIKARKSTDIGTRGNFKAAPIGKNAIGAATELRASVFQTELSFLSPRIITPNPNHGSICPAWLPEGERMPLDEGEAIDLALPPANREPLRREREVLIETLAKARSRNPRDEWVTGQHFRFVLDQRSPTRAVDAARECRGSAPFCARLMGMALAALHRTPDAEQAFRRAEALEFAEAPGDTASCIHSEILLLLAPGDRDVATKGECSEQRAFTQRMWWLADPLWSVPGNERYVAHESRRAHGNLRSALERDERYTWAKLGGGDAFRELLVRYGWPHYTYWPGNQLEEEINKVRENPARPRLLAQPYTAVEYSGDRTALIPSVAAIADPFAATPAHWDLRLRQGASLDQWWPREHMMLWTTLHALEPGQQGQWRRDSTVIFGIVVDNPLFGLDTGARGPNRAALVASTSPTDIRVLGKTALFEGETLRLAGEIPARPTVISAEIEARTQREPAQRLRQGLHPVPSLRDMKPDEVAISAPVFLRVLSREVVLPNNLDAAALFMTGTLDFNRTDTLALFWESYGFIPDDSVQFQLRVNRNDDPGLARRIGDALGIASGLRDSVSIKWTEPDARNGASVLTGVKPVMGRSVALDLKALPAGQYIVSIEMRGRNGAMARNQRAFIVR